MVYTCKVCGRIFHDDDNMVLVAEAASDCDVSIIIARCPDCQAILLDIDGDGWWAMDTTYIPFSSSLKHSLIRLVEVIRRWVEER